MRCLWLIVLLGFSSNYVHAQSKKTESKRFYVASVYLTDGSVKSGQWVSCTDSVIIISVATDTVALQPENVYKIEMRKSNPKRSVRLGAGIGFAVGFAIGFTAFDSGDTDIAQLGHAAGGGLIGAFTGAIIGQIVGMMAKTHYILGSADQYSRILPDLEKYNPIGL